VKKRLFQKQTENSPKTSLEKIPQEEEEEEEPVKEMKRSESDEGFLNAVEVAVRKSETDEWQQMENSVQATVCEMDANLEADQIEFEEVEGNAGKFGTSEDNAEEKSRTSQSHRGANFSDPN
jgi:hypothetical protein